LLASGGFLLASGLGLLQMGGMIKDPALGSARPTIVFDLDGTLAETAPDIIGTLNTILEREGLAPLPVSKARDLVGAGAKGADRTRLQAL
jgi:hypothetical protein